MVFRTVAVFGFQGSFPTGEYKSTISAFDLSISIVTLCLQTVVWQGFQRFRRVCLRNRRVKPLQRVHYSRKNSYPNFYTYRPSHFQLPCQISIDPQLSTVNCQLSTVNCQLSPFPQSPPNNTRNHAPNRPQTGPDDRPRHQCQLRLQLGPK
ncbi:MAG: hypothetical protein HC849_28870, partial [Oscillatoriales cyanobacterium RU_3_3]|nr:hypothetical protein [Oscillatoriales cyanobacterium RU_3_3]